MNEQYKKGIRWKLFNLFGPPEVKGLIDHIDQLTSDGSGIIIYQTGNFSFSVKTSASHDLQPLRFPTMQERASFQAGLNLGIGIMGGSTAMISEDEYNTLNEMEKRSTHGGGNQRNN